MSERRNVLAVCVLFLIYFNEGSYWVEGVLESLLSEKISGRKSYILGSYRLFFFLTQNYMGKIKKQRFSVKLILYIIVLYFLGGKKANDIIILYL